MASTKKGGMTEEDIKGLQSLYDTLSKFHQDIKGKAQEANAQNALVVRRYFEKFLAQTSSDLSAIEARIRRAEMALFRKDTRALLDAQEEDEEKGA